MSNNPPSPMNIGGRGSPRDEQPQGTPGDRRYGTPPVANIPPRVFDSPRPPSAVPNYGSAPQRPAFNPGPTSGSGTATPTLNGDDDSDRARVVRRHLVSAEERTDSRRPSAGGISLARPQFLSRPSSGAGSTSQGPNPAPGPDLEEPFPIPYGSHGGDVTHEIYKWHADQGREHLRRPRSVSFSGPEVSVDPAFRHIHEPGGFRRNYVMLAAREQGQENPRMLHNFIEFLYLYGHFAGEDLEEEEEDDAGTPPTDEEQGPLLDGATTDEPESRLIHRSVASLKPSERTPLMSRSMSHASVRRRRRQSVGSHGDATVTQAVLMLLKSFVGTGVLFLGKAFFNGGMLFSTVVLVVIALVSLWSFLLLVYAKFEVSGSFGDIGGVLYGNWMRQLILASIVISQLGFVSAYLIFVAENLQAFILAVSKCQQLVSTTTLIFAQLVLFIPLSLVRNLAKLSTTALVADGFILVGLVYLFSMEAKVISDRGGVADIKWFNEKDFPLLIGTAVFSFEGVGLVIPITDAMREPRKFPKVLTGVMLFLVVLFGGSGALAYAAFGSKIETVVLKNLPQSSKPVQTVQFLYSLAILLSTPLQLFPALRILETALFVKSGKTSLKVKWTKNAFRLLVVLGCVGVSIFGAKDLDKFVSFVGSCACVPLCFVYPAMLHYKAVAKTRFQKGSDIALMVFGMSAAIYTSFQTIKLMAAPSGPAEPVGHCIPPAPEPGSGNGPDSPFWPGGRFF
ncbi:Vacuolar amino acid transporter 3 [Schizosaccharomyces pombe 972h-] [Rhizoctonia solani]|uniref:Vacuolar amino acid transporter 3 [Schizosaccharomyces pombe 972h-] n=1 Tax=Rhizoctonia solani TaxID=456999 RepID=A0A0K6FZP7_9AGAM|nr:Vacuolar amino acid transporter 3 [Schizosaccharomyces pombe 972h-] [Rhizoctonia solani]